MSGPRNLRAAVVLAFALGVVLPSAAMAEPSTTGSLTVDQLPDLRMAKLYDVQIRTSSAGRKKLRFGTVVWNLGDGPLGVRGRARDNRDMTEIYQWIAHEGGGGHEVAKPAARMFYSGDGHNHWHVQGFIVMELYLKSSPQTVRRLRKIGFCLVDLRRTPGAGPGGYPVASCGSQSTQNIGPPTRAKGMGISAGWGDDYQPSFAHQAIDIQGLPNGTYRLCATVNPDGLWTEKGNNMTNNSFWFDLSLNAANSNFTILAKGRTACRPAGVAAVGQQTAFLPGVYLD